MSVSGIGAGASAGGISGSNSALSPSQFYQLIVAQLENQNPDNAADTNQMVEEMMNLSNYQSTTQSAANVAAMTNYSLGTSLLGKTVAVDVPQSATSAEVKDSGVVTQIALSSGQAYITINGNQYLANNVTTVQNPAAAPAAGSGN